MPPEWLKSVADVMIFLDVISALIVAGDIVAGHRQKMAIMNLVWPVTGLYLGPLGLWAYWVMGRSGRDHGGDRKPFWQTVFIATSHCGAGCTLGDAIGESAIFATGLVVFGSALLTAFVVDFCLAYLFGVVFQFFSIAPMRNLGLRDGLLAAIKADTISLIAFEVGMFSFMALNRLVFFSDPPGPNTLSFWFLMQLAMIVGFATSYPANWWLVKTGVKEAM